MNYKRCGFKLSAFDAGYYDGINGALVATHINKEYLAGYKLGNANYLLHS